jgi:DNA mismatch repair ATPase MutS
VFLVAVVLLAPLAFLLSTKLGALAVATSWMANMGFHFWATRRLQQALGSLDYVGALIRAAAQVGDLPLEGLETTTERLRARCRQLSRLASAASEVALPALVDDFPGEYLRIAFLTRERRLNRCAELIESHREALTEVMELLGTLDAARAAAAFAARRQTVAPEFVEEGPLELEAAVHPLLESGVANDAHVTGGLLITGSNMSGKSTWLRTLALNTLLAQSLGFCCAVRYRGPVLRVASSLRSQDALARGRSSWSAEALRLRELLEVAADPRPALLLLDEPFRGTNTTERIASAVAVLKELDRRGALVVAATHDFEVTSLLGDGWQAGYFVETIDEAGLRFDFRFRVGRAAPRNAVRLLEVLGFPPTVVAEARALALQER